MPRPVLGARVKEPAWVPCVGNVMAEEQPFPGKVDLGRQAEVGWGACTPSDAMASALPRRSLSHPVGMWGLGKWRGEKRRLLDRGREGKDSLKGQMSAAEAAGPFKRLGWLCGGFS